MGYENRTIKEVIEDINSNKIYLPAIQRKFVWKPEQIEKLFDSIMRGYPIGTFLFWFLEEENVNKYTFYKFIQNYHQRDNYKNEISPRPELKKDIIGVLDGQQRLSSMYIALQGTYAYKRLYCSWNNDNAFPKRKLYINLFTITDEDEVEYEFKFLDEIECKIINSKHLWFEVKNVLLWGNDPSIDEYYDDLVDSYENDSEMLKIIKNNRNNIKKTLRILHQRIVQDSLISYFKISEQELDKILEIFIRVNSAGTVLSKSDLLFSTIVAHWENGREEIDQLISTLNKKGDGFRFDSDLIMRACLFLTDAPILFKVESFRKDNIDKIKTNWDKIKIALDKSVELLVEWGFSYENLTSLNSIIPLAYYFILTGKGSKDDKVQLRKYLISSLVKRIYGNQGDQALSHVREAFKVTLLENSNSFRFDKFVSEFELRSKKSIRITNDDIDEILEFKKGPYAFMILSLLYPNLKYGQVKFHQDHIHPSSFFTEPKLTGLGISKKDISEWINMKDKLPNLQLMEGSENESKNNTPFIDWLNTIDDKIKYKEDNYIDINSNEELINFKEFFESRKGIMKNCLEDILLVN